MERSLSCMSDPINAYSGQVIFFSDFTLMFLQFVRVQKLEKQREKEKKFKKMGIPVSEAITDSKQEGQRNNKDGMRNENSKNNNNKPVLRFTRFAPTSSSLSGPPVACIALAVDTYNPYNIYLIYIHMVSSASLPYILLLFYLLYAHTKL